MLSLLLVVSLPPPDNGFCIRNLTQDTLFFAVDVGEHGRRSAPLAPNETLCSPPLPAATGGFVSVFLHAGAIEGCSRLAGPGPGMGMRIDLLEYADFDRCTWAK